MKLSEIRQLLGREEIRLTKSLGQNFLHDAEQLRRIVGAAELREGERVLEIGPGLGPLTELLLERKTRVLAIEKDLRLVRLLQERLGDAPGLELLGGDALDYLRGGGQDWSGWKVVSNLPYSVASPILVELAGGERSPERLVVTLQSEVAQRLVAEPGSKDYGVLTLLVGIAYEPAGMFKIPSSCFFPEPDVESACVTLKRRAAPLLSSAERARFTKIVKRGFSQRRKMMVKLLKADWPLEALEAALDELGLDRRIRAEKVSLNQFVALARGIRDARGR